MSLGNRSFEPDPLPAPCVQRWLAECASRYAGVRPSQSAFEAAIRRAHALQGELPDAGADLALAVACDEHRAGAWEELSRQFRDRLARTLRGRGFDARRAEELVQDLFGELASPPPRGAARTRIGTYGGRASLVAWLLVILVRRAADEIRARQRDPLHAAEGADATWPDGRSDPQRDSERVEERVRVQSAFEQAFRSLPAREALALRLRHQDEIELADLARVLSVGVPRASRIVQRAEQRFASLLASHLGRSASRWKLLAPRRTRFERHALRDWLANLGGDADSLRVASARPGVRGEAREADERR